MTRWTVVLRWHCAVAAALLAVAACVSPSGSATTTVDAASADSTTIAD